MATVLEARLSKEEILELYLNEIYLGQQGSVGIHGIGEASRFYFAKDAHMSLCLRPHYWPAMIQAPSALNPIQSSKRCKTKSRYSAAGNEKSWLYLI